MQGGKNSSRSKALVEYREGKVKGKKCKHEQYKNYCSKSNGKQLQHQGPSFTFHNSTVTYGNADGSYISTSTTRMTGSDGLTFLESKEAETSTRQGKRKSSETSVRQGKRKISDTPTRQGKCKISGTPTRQAKSKSSGTASGQAKRKSSNTATRQVRRKISGGFHNKGHCNLNEGEVNYELLRFEHSWEGYDTSSSSENFSGYICIDCALQAIEGIFYKENGPHITHNKDVAEEDLYEYHDVYYPCG